MIVTRPVRLALLCVISSAVLFMTGCTQHYYAPPPPLGFVSPLVERADQIGFRDGRDDGARDAYNGTGYHPQQDRKFHNTPGYDPSLGPYAPYRDSFRGAYLRGYDQGYSRR